MTYEKELRIGFEKAKAEDDVWLMNFYGSSLQHVRETNRRCKEMSDQRMHKYEEIRKNAKASAEQKYLEAKMVCNIEKSDKKIDLVWVVGIFFLAFAYFWLISILCR